MISNPISYWSASRGPGNITRDCDVFCVFCRTEVNEKTIRPETYSPGNNLRPLLGLDEMAPHKITCLKALNTKSYSFWTTSK